MRTKGVLTEALSRHFIVIQAQSFTEVPKKDFGVSFITWAVSGFRNQPILEPGWRPIPLLTFYQCLTLEW